MPQMSEDRRSERRQSLIDAAWKCAAREGHHIVTVDDAAWRQGQQGHALRRLPSKRTLLLALLAEDAGLVDSLIGGLTDGPVNGADRLRRRHGIARHPWVMTNHGIQAQ
jgi:hypothetical protein